MPGTKSLRSVPAGPSESRVDGRLASMVVRPSRVDGRLASMVVRPSRVDDRRASKVGSRRWS
ncbi:MAG TPA: hypothetical protein VMZ53_11715, partial [Kofleriaceae bacterium]|nr:hypothetical protein [Kofleriaceae bacterium]